MKKLVNRNKNRLEKLINACVDKEIKPHWGSLWGQKSWCIPAYCGVVNGDARQVVWLKTGDSRPNFYIMRIDSKIDVESDDFDLEILYCGVEEMFDNVDNYEEDYIDGKYLARYKYADDDEPWFSANKVGFPMLSTGNGAFWGSVKIF